MTKRVIPTTKGYEDVRDRIKRYGYHTRSCMNCAYYYQSVGDKEELCQNQSVIQADMIVNGHNVCCTQWVLATDRKKDNNLFKPKSGRDRFLKGD